MGISVQSLVQSNRLLSLNSPNYTTMAKLQHHRWTPFTQRISKKRGSDWSWDSPLSFG